MPRHIAIRNGRVKRPVAEPALPSLVTQAGNLLQAGRRLVTAAVRGERLVVPAEVADQRRAQCEACPRFRKSDGRCALCGCGTRGMILDKLQFATEQCPAQPPRWLRWKPSSE